MDSPCVKVCVIDPASGYCEGCLRTLSEIACWTSMRADERRRVLSELAGRRTMAGDGTRRPSGVTSR